jgi:hypothetical protein
MGFGSDYAAKLRERVKKTATGVGVFQICHSLKRMMEVIRKIMTRRVVMTGMALAPSLQAR